MWLGASRSARAQVQLFRSLNFRVADDPGVHKAQGRFPVVTIHIYRANVRVHSGGIGLSAGTVDSGRTPAKCFAQSRGRFVDRLVCLAREGKAEKTVNDALIA